MIYKAYKYRIYPTEQQRVLLAKHFGAARFVYNWGLALRTQEYEKHNKHTNYFFTTKKLTELKSEETYSWLKEINSQSLQASLKHLDMAYTKFFREKKGYPKFKSKRTNSFSFQVPQGTSLEDNYLIIPKFRKGIKIKLHRSFEGIIKSATISKTPSGKYFASLLVETHGSIPVKQLIVPETVLGIDFGIKTFATLSDGTKIDNPARLKKSLKRLRRLSKKHSYKVNSSKNKNKSRIALAKLYEKVSNQRKDFLHKLSHQLICENQASALAIEDLSIKEMISNTKSSISRSVLDTGWYTFTQQLEYKSEWYGKPVIKIGRFEPSSKLCNACGKINSSLSLNQRTWTCTCGALHDRDVLAANNIKVFALKRQNLIGLERPKFKPAEIAR